MRIESLGIREIHLSLKNPFETSFGTIQHRRILLVEAHCDGIIGWGELTVENGPYYNSECVDAAWIVFQQFVAPRLVNKIVAGPSDTRALLSGIRGHEMTKAAVENALWDIDAQQKGVSLARLLGGIRTEISSGVSLGIRDTAWELLETIEAELAAGYQRIKIKIKPGRDVEVAAAVRQQFPQIQLMVDANSAYRLSDLPLLKRLDAYNLMMIEQPLEWDEIFEHARLQAELSTPICLDECIHNLRNARAAIEMGACRILNIKLGRVGGHTEAREIQEYCRKRSVPAWCGGMLESGIGRAHNIAMSALPGFVLPGDISASQRYWDEDVIDPEVEVTPQGTIRVPTMPGLGYRVRQNRIEQLTVRKESFSARVSVPVGS
ncbi:MAG TPA: o-succinylbenzoate synthase [Terriglobales bacterium]|nr:o-succinylbenzoate synthase [Terriglobales bacterium]